MDKLGQVFIVSFIFGLMLGIIGFMCAMIFIDPLTDVITEARSDGQLNCTSSEITDGQQATCLLVDIILPLFIGAVCWIAGSYMGAKFLGG